MRGDVFDEPALKAGMSGNEIVYHVAGIDTFCPTDPAALFHVNVRGAEIAVRAAHAAEVPRVVLTSSAAALGEAEGTVGNEDSPHRGSYMSVYERTSTRARSRPSPPRGTGIDLVAVNPSSVQGPGRAGGTGRIMIAYLNGKLKVFVHTRLSIVDIDDTVEGHILAAEKGQPGERYVINGATLLAEEAFGIVNGSPASSTASASSRRPPPASSPPGRGRLTRARQEAAAVPRDDAHDAARPPLRQLTRDDRARPAVHAGRGHLPAHHRLGRGAEGLTLKV